MAYAGSGRSAAGRKISWRSMWTTCRFWRMATSRAAGTAAMSGTAATRPWLRGFGRERRHPWRTAAPAGGGQGRGDLRLRADCGRSARRGGRAPGDGSHGLGLSRWATLAEFDALTIPYPARIRSNAVRNRMAEPHLDKPADLAPGEVRTVFREHDIPGEGLGLQAARGPGRDLFGAGAVPAPLLVDHEPGPGTGRGGRTPGLVPRTGQVGEQIWRVEGRAAGATALLSTAEATLCRQDDRPVRSSCQKGGSAAERSPSPARPASGTKPCTRVASRWRVPPGTAGASAPSLKGFCAPAALWPDTQGA